MMALPKTIENKLILIFSKFSEIKSVKLFGSRALGNARKGSDIDLCLFGESCDYQLIAQIKNELDLLNSPYLFDIIIYHKIESEALKAHINQFGETIYEHHS
jgi:predicted nucleotidyltransferase